MENFFVEKPTLEDLKLYDMDELKHFENTYNYCFDYLSNFQVFDLDSFRKVLDMCDEIMVQEIIDAIPALNDNGNILAYERLYNLVIKSLKKEINGISIGDILISKSLEEGRVLTVPELAYDCHTQYEQIGLSRLPRFYHMGGKSTFYGITDFKSQDILINGYSLSQRIVINRNEEKARKTNLDLLTVIRHEIQHAKQGKDYQSDTPEGKIMNEMIAFESYLRQNFNRTGLYHAMHDLFPTEYEADIVSYEKTISDLSARYKNKFSNEMIRQIGELYTKKTSNYPNKPLDEIVSYIFEMLYNTNLPEDQRVEILTRAERLNECISLSNTAIKR